MPKRAKELVDSKHCLFAIWAIAQISQSEPHGRTMGARILILRCCRRGAAHEVSGPTRALSRVVCVWFGAFQTWPVEAASGEFEYGHDLLTSDVVLLDDFVDA